MQQGSFNSISLLFSQTLFRVKHCFVFFQLTQTLFQLFSIQALFQLVLIGNKKHAEDDMIKALRLVEILRLALA